LLGAIVALNPIGLDFLQSAFLSGEQLSRNIARPIVLSALAVVILLGIVGQVCCLQAPRRRR